MPIFMDRHDVKGASAEQVAEVHQKDLKVQEKFGCKGITYWFDEKTGLAFCLIEAPQMKAVVDMHKEAHGLVPNRIIRVDEDAVYSFLGRISDPFKHKERDLVKIINETGVRTILHLEAKYPIRYFENIKREHIVSNLIEDLSVETVNAAGGSKVDEDSAGLTASFISQNDALKCAENVQSVLKKRKSAIKVSIGISAGSPVEGSRKVFGDTVRTAKNLSYTALPGRTFVSSSLSHFSGKPLNLSASNKTFKSIQPDEEIFLNNLIDYAEVNLDNFYTRIDHCCEQLGISKSKLYRKTVSLTSYSPAEFLKEFRLKMAMRKIIKREGNIAEIAFAAGFNTPSYFTQCFKERFGILPSDYVISIS